MREDDQVSSRINVVIGGFTHHATAVPVLAEPVTNPHKHLAS